MSDDNDNLIPEGLPTATLVLIAKATAEHLVKRGDNVGIAAGRLDMLAERVAGLTAPEDRAAFAPMAPTLREFARRQRVEASAAERLAKAIEKNSGKC